MENNKNNTQTHKLHGPKFANYQLQDRSLTPLPSLLPKLTLQNSQTIRKLKASAWGNIQIETNHALLVRIQKEFTKYVERVKVSATRADLGPPAGYLFIALLGHLEKNIQNISKQKEDPGRQRQAKEILLNLTPVSEVLFDADMELIH